MAIGTIQGLSTKIVWELRCWIKFSMTPTFKPFCLRTLAFSIGEVTIFNIQSVLDALRYRYVTRTDIPLSLRVGEESSAFAYREVTIFNIQSVLDSLELTMLLSLLKTLSNFLSSWELDHFNTNKNRGCLSTFYSLVSWHKVVIILSKNDISIEFILRVENIGYALITYQY